MPKERREVSEERVFWGIENVPKPLMGNPLLSLAFTTPDRERRRAYLVFDSREEAERFAREAYQEGTGDIGGSTLHELLNNIRKIEPNEIPADQDVSLNGDVPVKWSELTGDDAPPVT
jgi:hypothetical protein